MPTNILGNILVTKNLFKYLTYLSFRLVFDIGRLSNQNLATFACNFWFWDMYKLVDIKMDKNNANFYDE